MSLWRALSDSGAKGFYGIGVTGPIPPRSLLPELCSRASYLCDTAPHFALVLLKNGSHSLTLFFVERNISQYSGEFRGTSSPAPENKAQPKYRENVSVSAETSPWRSVR